MRKTRKVTILLLSFLFVMISFSMVHAEADLVTLDSPLDPEENREGLEVYVQSAQSRHNGGERIDPQKFQAIVKPATSELVQVVSWATRNKVGWSRDTLKRMAADYQLNHPGYIVLGGINGDFFHINGNYEPQNNFVSDGDVIKKDSRYHSTTKSWFMNVLGFKDNGGFVTGPAYAEDHISLKILSGRSVTDEFEVEKINELPSDDGIGLFFPGSVVQGLDVTGYTLYKGSYDVLRQSTSLSEIKNITGYVGDDLGQRLGSYLKGSVAEVLNDEAFLSSVESGAFYLVSKNTNLTEKLMVGTTIKCEYNLIGDFAGIRNTMGYSIQCLKDGIPYRVDDGDTDYHVNSNPRALVGFKPDGSVVFCTVDGRQEIDGAVGCSVYEAGEILRLLGCDNGFNLDGGGSATLILRNANGDFDIINSPSDKTERQIANCLLFVMRDPKIRVTDVSTDSITVEQLGAVSDGTIQNVQVQISGGGLGSGLEFKPMTENKVVFDGLLRDTKYTISYKYEIAEENGHVLSSEITKVDATTLGAGVPQIDKFRISSKSGSQVTFSYRILTDEVTSISAMYIGYGDLKYDLTEEEAQVTIDSLSAGKEYDFELVIEYQLNGQERIVRSETLSYTVPYSSAGCAMAVNFGILELLGLVSMLAASMLLKRR